MSVLPKLVIDGIEITLLEFNFKTRQEATYNGTAAGRPVFEGLRVKFLFRDDVDLISWALARNQTKQIQLRLYPLAMNGRIRTVYFFDCHLAKYIQALKGQVGSMTQELFITSAGMEDSIADFNYSADWRETSMEDLMALQNVKVEEEEMPTLTEYRFEDKKQNRIEEKDLKPGQDIILIVTTKDANGKTMKIDLNHPEIDFMYEGKLVKNDVLTGIYVYGDEVKVRLTTVKQ